MYCTTCDKHFARAFNFERHKESEYHKKRITNSIHSNKYECTCGKIYNHRQSYHRHIKVCTLYNKPQQEDEIEKMKKQIEYLLEQRGNMQTIGTQNNHNINIQINAFGHENTEYITDNLYHNCICRIYDSIPCLIEQVHFNPKHPENHNVKITNKKLPHASILSENQQWKLMDKQQVIQDMMYNGYNLLDDKFKENPTQFSEVKRRQYRKFQNEFDNEQKETVKRVKTDVEMAILNGSKKIYK